MASLYSESSEASSYQYQFRGDDKAHGEVPRAVIVLKAGAALEKKEIRAYCEQHLAKYKIPRIIEFRASLPKTPGGKILRRDLPRGALYRLHRHELRSFSFQSQTQITFKSPECDEMASHLMTPI